MESNLFVEKDVLLIYSIFWINSQDSRWQRTSFYGLSESFHNKVFNDLQSQKVRGLTLPNYPKDLKQRQELMEWTQHWYQGRKYWRNQIKIIRHLSIGVHEFFLLLLDMGFTSEGKKPCLYLSS